MACFLVILRPAVQGQGHAPRRRVMYAPNWQAAFEAACEEWAGDWSIEVQEIRRSEDRPVSSK